MRWRYHALGRACLLLGRLDEARSLARPRGRILAVSAAGSRPMRCTCSATSRPIPTGSMPRRGEAHYREALALAEPRGMRPLVAHCHLGLGKLYRRTGKREQAHEHLTTAATMYREMDMRFWLEKAETEMEKLRDREPVSWPRAAIDLHACAIVPASCTAAAAVWGGPRSVGGDGRSGLATCLRPSRRLTRWRSVLVRSRRLQVSSSRKKGFPAAFSTIASASATGT